jgi:hypothetical protein
MSWQRVVNKTAPVSPEQAMQEKKKVSDVG